MKWLRLSALVAFGLTLLFLELSFEEFLPPMGLILGGLACTLIFFFALWKGESWQIHLFLGGCAALTMWAAWREAEELWLILANLSALATWDGLRIYHLFRTNEATHGVEIIRWHGGRLAGVLLVSAALTELALNLRLELNLGWALCLILAVALGVRQMGKTLH